jgi:HSP20 family protein
MKVIALPTMYVGRQDVAAINIARTGMERPLGGAVPSLVGDSGRDLGRKPDVATGIRDGARPTGGEHLMEEVEAMMRIRRGDPFRELMNLQDEINRLFREVFRARPEEEMAGGWTPAADIYENTDGLEILFDLPGINKNEIHVSVEKNVLTVSGERRLEHEAHPESYHRVERPYGRFSRSFTLSPNMDIENISAEYRDGVLRVLIPKKPEAKPRQVEIKVK